MKYLLYAIVIVGFSVGSVLIRHSEEVPGWLMWVLSIFFVAVLGLIGLLGNKKAKKSEDETE